MTTIDRALNSIGKRCFVKYYHDFKNCSNKEELARKLLSENRSASSLNAQRTRINYAIWIFENKLEREALEAIVASNRIDFKTVKNAQMMLKLL